MKISTVSWHKETKRETRLRPPTPKTLRFIRWIRRTNCCSQEQMLLSALSLGTNEYLDLGTDL